MDVTIPCPCPVKATGEPRHTEDTITLLDKLGFRQGVALRKSIGVMYEDEPDSDTADLLAVLVEKYLLVGIVEWTLVDERGKPVAVTRSAVRDFMEEHTESAMTVGDAADDLYSGMVLLPLLARARENSTSSPTTPTAPSTSATKRSSRKRPTSSKPSSTSTTQTGGTVTIISSRDGDSNSSQSSASAA